MGNIIRLHGDEHQQAQQLLPWYATGTLDGGDRARLEAHLSVCSECQSELVLERRLHAEVGALPVEVEHAWASMLQRVEHAGPQGGAAFRAWLAGLGRQAGGLWRTGGPWLGWAATAAIALTLIGSPLIRQTGKPAAYHALASAPAHAVGDMVVIFRPQASEQAIRQALRDSHARLVDGPTAADAYVLDVPAAERAVALAKLRAKAAVVLAEPIDTGESP